MDDVQKPDEWLMLQVSRGRNDCLATLLRRHADGLFTFIFRMIGRRHRAEELFQEVFLLVFNRRNLYEYPRPFRPWLYAIAANACRADFRKAAPGSVPLEEFGPAAPESSEPTPDEAAERNEQAALVVEAVTQLPSQQRLVVVLRVWNQLSYNDIAAVAGCSEATARSHMHAALAGLRKLLEMRL